MKQFKQFLIASQGSISVLLLTTLMTLAALSWMGHDLRLLSSAFIGDGGDTFANSWALHQAMMNLVQRPFDLGYSTIFYGEPSSFAYTIAPYAIALVMLPIYLITNGNLELTYNLYWIATFPLTAWAIYLLVRYLLPVPRPIAVFAGLMVAFAQFRFLHIGHIETLSMQFYILGMYCLHRLLDSPRFRWILGFAALFWFTQFSSGYLGIYYLVTSALIVGFIALKQQKLFFSRLLRPLLIAATMAAIFALPFLLFRFRNPSFRTGFFHDNIVAFSATPQDWFLGNSQIYTGILPYRDEVILFLGFTPIILSIAAWHYARLPNPAVEVESTKNFEPNNVVALYGIIVLVGYLMTLGPVLRIGETAIAPLPYLIFEQLPGFAWMRVPARFIIMALLGTGVLSAYTLMRFSKHTDRFIFRVCFFIVILFLAIELIPFNGSRSNRIMDKVSNNKYLHAKEYKVNIPPVYQWLKDQPENTPVFHYPNSLNAVFDYHIYQPYHKQPMLNGYGSIFPVWHHDINWTVFPSSAIMQILHEKNVRYVLVHYELMSAEEQADFKQRLDSRLEKDLLFVESFEQTDVYEVVR